MTPYEELYGRKCRTPMCQEKVGDKGILGPKLIQETMENIRPIHKKMNKIQIGRRVMQINVGDLWNSMKEIIFFLKVISKLGINRLFKTNKLSQRYIGLYQILS